MHSGTSKRAAPLVALLTLVVLGAPAAASVESELAFHRGVVAYGEGRLEEARTQFERVLAEDPEDTVALHYLGLIAQRAGDLPGALSAFERASALDPEDADLLFDRALAQLEARQLPEARASFARVLELEPDRARAHLFAGIAAYRAGAYQEAKPHLARAAELDPTLADESRYYAGLADAFQGDLAAADLSFAAVEEQSPLSPHGQSAQNLREQLRPPTEDRRWEASLTAGMEVDSNPLILGDTSIFLPLPDPDVDGRGVFRGRASYRVVDGEDTRVTAGYDGYLSLHIEEDDVNLWTHEGWLSVSQDVGRVRLGLRGDYAYTMVDTVDPFRHQVRATPSVSYQWTDWTISNLFYQYAWSDYRVDLGMNDVFDRDGDRHAVGLNQFFFLPEPFTYVRVGSLADWHQTEGSEWEYSGVEGSLGAGYDFPYDIGLSWLYRLIYRHYERGSFFSPTGEHRDDLRHVVSAELRKALDEHWEVSLGMSLTWSDSDVAFFDHDRQIGGAYVTYRF